MKAFFNAIWSWLKWIIASVVPFAKHATLSSGVRWFLFILVDLTIVGILWFLNYYYRPVIGPWLPDLLEDYRGFYLPILGQLLILLFLVLYWFYVLWFGDVDESPFPDIDAAWAEAIQALRQAGISLPNAPLFLVLGRPATSEANFFEASGMKLIVKQTPADPKAPLHVFADRDAVYVTCRGASVLGKLAGILAREDAQRPAAVGDSSLNADATERPFGGEKGQIRELVAVAEGREATTLERRRMYRLSLGKPLCNSLLSDTGEVARQKRRLAHLCRLIAADRQPHCAGNGIILLVPLAGTDTVGEAQVTAEACKDDLQVARLEMKIDCPLLTVVVDMEELPGSTDFIQRQNAKQLRNRRGSGFPMSTRLSKQEFMQEVHTSLNWVCSTYLQDSTYEVFQTESAANPDPAPTVPGNARLALMLAEMNERAESLRTIILRAIMPDNEPVFRYTGCYLAATGPKGSQAFVAALIEKMIKEQSAVTWTDHALAEDANNHAWANDYFLAACVLFLAWCGLVAWTVYIAFFRR